MALQPFLQLLAESAWIITRRCVYFLFHTAFGFRGSLSRRFREASCTALTSKCWICGGRVIFLSETRVRTAATAQNYFAASDLRTHESIALQERNSCSPTVVNVKGQNRSGIKGLDIFKRQVFILFLTKSKWVFIPFVVCCCWPCTFQNDFHATAGFQTPFKSELPCFIWYYLPKQNTIYRHSRNCDSLTKNGLINFPILYPACTTKLRILFIFAGCLTCMFIRTKIMLSTQKWFVCIA